MNAQQNELDKAPKHVQALSRDELESWIGRVIDGRYKIKSMLGAGGMGAVFVAEHLKLRKDVAFKIIREEHAKEDVFAARFSREAMTTAQLENPHIVSAIDYGMLEGGVAYLVLQLAPGKSLATVLHRHGALPWPQACLIGAQLADALVDAHAIGIVHRDLKPDNILVEMRQNGRLHARVLDFGLARIVCGEALETKGIDVGALTRQGALIGTPGYMAPEQITGGTVDGRADIYALGVIVWECISGRPLWRAESYTDLFAKQLGGEAPSLVDEQGGAVPERLVNLIADLLRSHPDDRPADAEPIQHALEELAALGGASAQSMTAGGVRPLTAGAVRAAGPVAAQGTIAIAVAQIRRDPAIRKFLVYMGIATAVVLTMVAGVLALRGGDAPGGPASVTSGATDEAQTPVPEDLKSSHVALRSADKASTRATAARTILGHEPRAEVPTFLRLAASIELADECVAKRDAVVELGELGDARAVPILERLQRAAKDEASSKKKKKSAPHACMQSELLIAIGKLAPGSDG